MAFLSCDQKEDFKILVDELGLIVGEKLKILQIAKLISKSINYDKVIVKVMLQVITKRQRIG